MGKKSQREVALQHERWAAQLLEEGHSDFEKAQVRVLTLIVGNILYVNYK